MRQLTISELSSAAISGATKYFVYDDCFWNDEHFNVEAGHEKLYNYKTGKEVTSFLVTIEEHPKYGVIEVYNI